MTNIVPTSRHQQAPAHVGPLGEEYHQFVHVCKENVWASHFILCFGKRNAIGETGQEDTARLRAEIQRSKIRRLWLKHNMERK